MEDKRLLKPMGTLLPTKYKVEGSTGIALYTTLALQLASTMKLEPQKGVQRMTAWQWGEMVLAELPQAFTGGDFVKIAREKYGKEKSNSYRKIRSMLKYGRLRKLKDHEKVLYMSI